ncbi:MAG: polyphosphate:AMP phosphotransferase [Methanomassiliicoccales archaeon]
MQLKDIDLESRLSKDRVEVLMPPLRLKLGELQRLAREKSVPVIITFDGWDTREMADHVNEVIRALDPRGFDLYTMEEPLDEERQHDFIWRFARHIPLKGRIALFDRSWYSRTVVEAAEGSDNMLALRTAQIANFEHLLADQGNIFIKLFFHMSRKELRRRIEKAKETEENSCVNSRSFLKREKHYSEYLDIVERVRAATDVPWAPWTGIAAEDDRFAIAEAFQVITNTLQARLAEPFIPQEEVVLPSASSRLLLQDINLRPALTLEEYRPRLKSAQNDLAKLQCQLRKRDRAMVVVMEGWDAAGKGGAIQRITEELNPRLYRVVSVGAPNDVELGHHYLWRFYVAMPALGHLTIFDRSWYGRVLVERVEGFCTEGEWKRAYREINDMEAGLVAEGTNVVKIWLQIDKDTQMQRFQEREAEPSKQWKITEDDWRNRSKWDAYEVAVQDMLRYTDTDYAPWTVVESNDKYFSRIKVLDTILAAAKGHR